LREGDEMSFEKETNENTTRNSVIAANEVKGFFMILFF